jgi:hypothetical protein
MGKKKERKESERVSFRCREAESGKSFKLIKLKTYPVKRKEKKS